eukprot:CAMPEP_0169169126 /NCGR_PEP_ID=MMETSP1015-20121227/61357_1 /TAXON_ID=342587 /ORGANISM="Karlodinium micrum, Strain CCMP2283" /LENGTH=30 /DNA_ID= /DNA_START= /DNA_END= /DNA_ORIENTATION=
MVVRSNVGADIGGAPPGGIPPPPPPGKNGC